MSWYKHGERRGYHHGNLRETLVKAALELIGDKGIGGVTFAEAARWAGVSPVVPYRHFRDREALLAEVARQGFEQFSPARWPSGIHHRDTEARRTRRKTTKAPRHQGTSLSLILSLSKDEAKFVLMLRQARHEDDDCRSWRLGG
jgi:AcrR family transcriptional regulator